MHTNNPTAARKLVKKSIRSVIFTFVLSSLLILLFLITKNNLIAILGLLFISTALIFNSAFLVHLFNTLLNRNIKLKSTIFPCLFFIVNLFIGMVYYEMAMNVIGPMGVN
ncbi:hypothetical protein [Formosa sp. S-31]|uniref:hypothetical protein n=1 Tax=Formosa sp. S-31 TaxID=2790949 RepID=UPI003EC05F19